MAKRILQANSNNIVQIAGKPTTNALKVRLDDLKAFDPLTHNQKLFFDQFLS